MKRVLIKCPPEVLLRSMAKNNQISRISGSCLKSPHVNKVSADSNIFHRRFYKAAICSELNKPLHIAVKESEALKSGEVRVQVAAVGVNFGDLLMQSGEYQVKLPLPFTPGSEMSGTVLEVAEDVKDFKAGMKVVGLCNMFGGYAEEVVTRAEGLWEMPERMSFKEAAGFVCSYGTAMMGLSRRADLKSGENVLVTAAAGAVGLAAVDIASNVFDANVIGAAGSEEKCEFVKSKGATESINYRKENVRDRMKEVCGSGADVVFDAVGGSIFKDALRSIAFEGRLVVVGFASGDIPKIPANHLLVKNVSAVGLYWGSYSLVNKEIFRWSVDRCFEEYNKGRIQPHVCTSFDLSEINSAFDFVRDRKSMGKVVVEIR